MPAPAVRLELCPECGSLPRQHPAVVVLIDRGPPYLAYRYDCMAGHQWFSTTIDRNSTPETDRVR